MSYREANTEIRTTSSLLTFFLVAAESTMLGLSDAQMLQYVSKSIISCDNKRERAMNVLVTVTPTWVDVAVENPFMDGVGTKNYKVAITRDEPSTTSNFVAEQNFTIRTRVDKAVRLFMTM
jgi:hypothetical protein